MKQYRVKYNGVPSDDFKPEYVIIHRDWMEEVKKVFSCDVEFIEFPYTDSNDFTFVLDNP